MTFLALQLLQQAARDQSLVDLKQVLASLSGEEKAQCWAVPHAVSRVLESMHLENQAMTWIPALQFIEILVMAGAPVPPLATTADQVRSPLQVAVSPSWLPHDADTYPLKPGELAIAKRVLSLLASRSGDQVPSEGLAFDAWKELDPWACLMECRPCLGLACDLVEEGVFPAWVNRPEQARLSQWPACPLVDLVAVLNIDGQARVWESVLRRGVVLPPELDREPALHHFCGLDLRPGAPALQAALEQGLDPRSRNTEHQSALEMAIGLPAPSLEDLVVLVHHDITLVDEPSSDGRTVYVVLMEALRGWDAVDPSQALSVQALQSRLRAYRRGVIIDERLPAAESPEPRTRF